MDLLSLLRSLGALGCVLGLLAGALWLVRRYDITLPGRVGGGRDKRVAVVERIQLDQRRSVVLLRRDDREHLFVLLPDRIQLLEGNIGPDASAPVRLTVQPQPQQHTTFADMVPWPALGGNWAHD